jgi:hypothetical protein
MKYEKPAVVRFGALVELTLHDRGESVREAHSLLHRS